MNSITEVRGTHFFPLTLSVFLTTPWTEEPLELAENSTARREHSEYKRWLPRSKSVSLTTPWTEEPLELAENSTARREHPEDIHQKVVALFAAARGQNFEDGMESEFSKELVYFVERYSADAVIELARLIPSNKVSAEVASEALRWLGRTNHPPSYNWRRWLLERSLFCSSARVRDGAILGLASLDDPHAIPYLEKALRRERYAELYKDIEQVLEQMLRQ